MTVSAAPAAPVGGTRTKQDVRRRIGEKWWVPYLFILPHLAIFLFIVGYPFFAGIYISLTDAKDRKSVV